jgi:SAM-dependent methyltransferase
VLDLGATPDASLPESNFFERLYPHRQNVTAASVEDASALEQRFPGVRFVRIGQQGLPFPDKHFDLLFCSAVVEHVGDRRQQAAFIREALRVTRGFFFTTPNRAFPMEFHTLLPFIHWLPQATHQSILRALGKEFWARTENLNLLTPGAMRALFPPCPGLAVRSLRLFGWPSNIVAYGHCP